MSIGTRIAIIRTARRITQREIAQMCLFSAQTVSNIETDFRVDEGSDTISGQIADIKTALRWGPEIDEALDKLEAALNG